MKSFFSAKAEEDLADIFNYIHRNLDNPVAAQNIVAKILEKVKKLSDFPEMGAHLQRVEAELAGYHYLLADNYLIIYKVADNEVVVLRLLHARSDYMQLLG